MANKYISYYQPCLHIHMLLETKKHYVNSIIIIVTGFWKTDRILTLGLFHFTGTANGYTCTLHIHSANTSLGGLICFSRASFANSVNS